MTANPDFNRPYPIAHNATIMGVSTHAPVISAHNIQHQHQTLTFNSGNSVIYEPNPVRIITMSDLHIGVRGREHIARKPDFAVTDEQANQVVVNAIRQSDHLVLNGDIFELYYVKDYSPEESIRSDITRNYIELVKNWASIAQEHGTTIHLLIGNHDDTNEFIDRLENEIGNSLSSVKFHPVGLRINDMMFSHGDTFFSYSPQGNIQQQERHTETEGEYLLGEKLIYKLPVSWQKPAGDALLSFKTFIQPIKETLTEHLSTQKEVNRLDKFIQKSPLSGSVVTKDGIVLPPATKVFSGHTHNYYNHVSPQQSAEDISYYNTGTLINSYQFNPIAIESQGIGKLKIQPVDMLSGILTPKQQQALDAYRSKHPDVKSVLPDPSYSARVAPQPVAVAR